MAIDTTTFTSTDKIKLKNFMDSAMQVFQETDDLKAGLRDVAKTLGEEFGIKASQMLKAAKIAYKTSLADEKESFAVIEELLELSGRGQ
jgi:hypothetical protein